MSLLGQIHFTNFPTSDPWIFLHNAWQTQRSHVNILRTPCAVRGRPPWNCHPKNKAMINTQLPRTLKKGACQDATRKGTFQLPRKRRRFGTLEPWKDRPLQTDHGIGTHPWPNCLHYNDYCDHHLSILSELPLLSSELWLNMLITMPNRGYETGFIKL